MRRLWFTTLLLLIALVTILGACRKVPTAPQSYSGQSNEPLAGRADLPGLLAKRLQQALAAYDWQPTSDRAAEVWIAVAALDERLANLANRATQVAGGVRAEVEIERIELMRERDTQLQRFQQIQERVRSQADAIGGGNRIIHVATSFLGETWGPTRSRDPAGVGLSGATGGTWRAD